MLRVLGFFIGTLIALRLLQAVPLIGRVFHGLLGFWLAAIVVSLAVSWLAEWLLRRRRLSDAVRALGYVDSPHNQGKLGTLLAAHGNHARATASLEKACAGEPEVASWHYQLGLSQLALDRPKQALPALERAAALDAEHAYGGLQLALARAYASSGQGERALEVLERFDHSHGPTPESCYRRARVQTLLGRTVEARASLVQVGALAAQAASFQRKGNRAWVMRAWLARLF